MQNKKFEGEIDALISHKRHKLLKITLPDQMTYCIKIFTFRSHETQKINLYCDHFERVKQWLKMRYSGKSLLKTIDKVQIQVVNEFKDFHLLIHIKVKTAYTDYKSVPTVQKFYQRVQMSREKKGVYKKQGVNLNFENCLYYIEEFFELILRGGSIPNFFYTPNNIFIHRPSQSPSYETGRLSLNYHSTVGLELLYIEGGDIIKEDLEEIFPLLPFNLGQLMKNDQLNRNKNQIQINRIIKMKGLAWNILAFILGYVPNILIRENLEVTLKLSKVVQLLKKARESMKELLQIQKKSIEDIIDITKINFNKFFTGILVNNCENITWSDIYQQLFMNNQQANQRKEKYFKKINMIIPEPQRNLADQLLSTTSFKVSQLILKYLWKNQNQKIKKFYLDRSINEFSMVYFLIRTNVKFRSLMKHLNIVEFLDEATLSAQTLKVHLDFIQQSIAEIYEMVRIHYPVPYGQVRSPYMTAENGNLYETLRPRSLIKRLSYSTNSQQPIQASYKAAEMICDLDRDMWLFD